VDATLVVCYVYDFKCSQCCSDMLLYIIFCQKHVVFFIPACFRIIDYISVNVFCCIDILIISQLFILVLNGWR